MTKVEKNWLEWCVLAASCVLVAGILGYLIYDAYTSAPTPPMLEVQLGQVEPRNGHFALPITIRNTGNQTAEAVLVQVVLTQQDGDEEEAEIELQFIARQSSRQGYVTFASDPRKAASVTARPLSFQAP